MSDAPEPPKKQAKVFYAQRLPKRTIEGIKEVARNWAEAKQWGRSNWSQADVIEELVAMASLGKLVVGAPQMDARVRNLRPGKLVPAENAPGLGRVASKRIFRGGPGPSCEGSTPSAKTEPTRAIAFKRTGRTPILKPGSKSL